MSDEAIYESAPLYRALKQYAEKNPARFHTPGHKASRLSPLSGIFGKSLVFDDTELPETDSLFDASGPILEAEELAARQFGTNCTLFSAGGASLCIQAMFRLIAPRGRRVVCARNVHRSAVNAMCLLGMEPVWVWPRRFEGSALPGGILPEDIEQALRKYPGAAGVFLTSPDYYGVISDIRGISAVCRRNGVPLLVDNSHGSHLICFEGMHPLRQGADMTCDSAHKTLPVLTGGAWLQIGAGFSRRQAKDAMALFGSTSPSYLILLSLDIARAWLVEEGREAFGRLAEKVGEIRGLARQKGFFFPNGVNFDPVRITLDFSSVGTDGAAAADAMRKFGISPEMWDSSHVVLLPSPFHTKRELDLVCRFIRTVAPKAPIRADPFPAERPSAAMPLREAVLAEREAVPVESAVNRIAAESRCPCPPGVPVVMPGEIITAKAAETLKFDGVLQINVVK